LFEVIFFLLLSRLLKSFLALFFCKDFLKFLIIQKLLLLVNRDVHLLELIIILKQRLLIRLNGCGGFRLNRKLCFRLIDAQFLLQLERLFVRFGGFIWLLGQLKLLLKIFLKGTSVLSINVL
jgi:hypothetical protein